jgi:hypothetical protein
VSRIGQYAFPLALAWWVNSRHLGGPAKDVPELPDTAWARDEQQRLLERSEDRLQSIESKGPGLATVCAIVAAAVVVSISLTWPDATGLGRALLVLSSVYALMSLYTPIKLVGPIARSTITIGQLAELAGGHAPERALAQQCAQAAADNDLATLRLSNLQVASRNALAVATVAFVVWAIALLFGCAT